MNNFIWHFISRFYQTENFLYKVFFFNVLHYLQFFTPDSFSPEILCSLYCIRTMRYVITFLLHVPKLDNRYNCQQLKITFSMFSKRGRKIISIILPGSNFLCLFRIYITNCNCFIVQLALISCQNDQRCKMPFLYYLQSQRMRPLYW